MTKKKTLTIVGCGKLGGIVADAVAKGILTEYELIGLYSRSHDKAEALAARMPQAPKVCGCIEELIALKPDYVVEAASLAAMRELALPALRGGSSVVTLSIGAFADDDFYAEVMTTAKAYGTRVY